VHRRPVNSRALSHSGRWRGVQARVGGLPAAVWSRRWTGCCAASAGFSDQWLFYRMSTVANPATGHATAGFAAVANRHRAVAAVSAATR
jgi:hypothetical protein